MQHTHEFHTISYGAFLADPDQGEASHSWCNYPQAWGDHMRKAEKAFLATGKAQAIHAHEDGKNCNQRCTALIEGARPETVG